MNPLQTIAVALAVTVAVSSCASSGAANGKGPMTDTEKGAVIGAVGGAVVGAVIADKKAKGALIGAVGGGLAGAAVGHYMDRQKQDLEKNLSKEIAAGSVRVAKLPSDIVRITMTSQTAFDTDSSDIKPGFYDTLNRLADVVVRYGKTSLTIVGHTDSRGTSQYNQALSERRARAVADYLLSKNVNPARIATVGKGETEPIATNATEEGRRQNRRVEIFVAPVRAE
ncbi:MAG: OmpA family protein [Betaproteobacteria bacterium]|nr:OmpA family protein [Betaproteobacteria bacterium]